MGYLSPGASPELDAACANQIGSGLRTAGQPRYTEAFGRVAKMPALNTNSHLRKVLRDWQSTFKSRQQPQVALGVQI